MNVRAGIGVLVTVLVLGALYLVRAATMAREHVGPDRGRSLVVEFSVEAKLLPSHELPLVAASIFNACRLQAQAGLEEPVARLSESRFQAVLSPAPNETDRKQLSGCLSDLSVAHTYTGNVQMREI